MDLLEKPVLFGAQPGPVDGMTLAAGYSEHGMTVVMHAHCTMRKKQMTLRVRSDDKSRNADIIGAIIPAMFRANLMHPAMMRRMFWALHDRLGEAGYEVSIDNCGKPNR